MAKLKNKRENKKKKRIVMINWVLHQASLTFFQVKFQRSTKRHFLLFHVLCFSIGTHYKAIYIYSILNKWITNRLFLLHKDLTVEIPLKENQTPNI